MAKRRSTRIKNYEGFGNGPIQFDDLLTFYIMTYDGDFQSAMFLKFRVSILWDVIFLAGDKSNVIAMFHHMFPSYPVHVPKRNKRNPRCLGLSENRIPQNPSSLSNCRFKWPFREKVYRYTVYPIFHLWTNGYRPIS